MKAIIGVDLSEQWIPAADLFVRLEFHDPEAVLVHSLESIAMGGLDPDMAFEVLPALQHEANARKELEGAANRMLQYHIPCETLITLGEPVGNLITSADKVYADLIVSGSKQKGRFDSFFFGSTGKGLVVGSPKSILIGKSRMDHAGPLTAVLATDHSENMNLCIEKLLQMKPKGIGRFIVVTANSVNPYYAKLMLERHVPNFDSELVSWVKGHLQDRTDAVCAALRPLNADCTSLVIAGDPESAIRSVMANEKADLLILGAKGHGFIQRLFVDSMAVHETVVEPFNTFIIRADG